MSTPSILAFAPQAAAIARKHGTGKRIKPRRQNQGIVKRSLKITDENGVHPLALAVRQPHAELILRGLKKPENRTWKMPHVTGWIYLYASPAKTIADFDQGLVTARETTPLFITDFPSRKQAETGGIVGAIFIEKWISADDPEASDPYFIGPYAAYVTQVRRLPLQPLRGSLGFFPVKVPKL